MKPDKVVCMNCGKQIQKGKWCSDSCRMAFKRNPNIQPEQKPEQTNPNIDSNTNISQPEQDKANIDEFRAGLTKTDKTFYDRAINLWKEPHYDFGGILRDSACAQCGDKYKTRMSLLKYCSYKCYSNAISGPRGVVYKSRPPMN